MRNEATPRSRSRIWQHSNHKDDRISTPPIRTSSLGLTLNHDQTPNNWLTRCGDCSRNRSQNREGLPPTWRRDRTYSHLQWIPSTLISWPRITRATSPRWPNNYKRKAPSLWISMRPSRRWSTNSWAIHSWYSWDRIPFSHKTTSARTDSMSPISTRLLWPRNSTTSNKIYWSSNTSTWYRMVTKRGTCSTFSVISQASGNHDRRSGTNSKWRSSETSQVPSLEKPRSQFKMFIC